MTGCGCKICKAGLGDFTNDLIQNGVSLRTTLEELKKRGVDANEKLLKKHLSAYEITYMETVEDLKIEGAKPVEVVLDDIDFSQYSFDYNDFESVLAYLQKSSLKILLNQKEIVLQNQQDVKEGNASEVNLNNFKGLQIAQTNFEKLTASDVTINQQRAIKVVESMGLTVQKPNYLISGNNVQDSTEPKTD